MNARTPRLTATGFDHLDLFGDTIEVAIASDGFGYASIQRMCDSIGIDGEAQRQKLNSCHWARTAIIKAPDARGHVQKAYALRHEDVARWLMTIRPSRVAFAVREKVKVWQDEGGVLLSAWFHGKTQGLAAIVLADPEAEARLARMAVLEQEIASLKNRLDVMADFACASRRERLAAQSDLRVLTARFDAVTHPLRISGCDFMSVKEFRNHADVRDEHGYPLADRRLPAVGRHLTAECASLGLPVLRREFGLSGGATNTYPIGLLYAWKVGHDLAARRRRAV